MLENLYFNQKRLTTFFTNNTDFHNYISFQRKVNSQNKDSMKKKGIKNKNITLTEKQFSFNQK